MANESNRRSVPAKSLTVNDEKLLEMARNRQAKLDAKREETAKRKAAQDAIRAARRAADQPLKTPEEKAADFKRLAKQRVNKVVKAMEAVTNLSNRSSYAYTDKDVETILAFISGAFARLEARFTQRKDSRDEFVI